MMEKNKFALLCNSETVRIVTIPAMICKKINGTLDFTEIAVQNNWEGHYINKMEYQLINH